MRPELNINFLAVLVAVVANFIIGFLWYGPIFGKQWMKEMGIPADFKPDQKDMLKSMGFMVIGSFLTAYVLFYSTNVWRASSWHAGEDSPAYVYGFFSGFYTWLGFYLPMQLNNVAFEGRSWRFFAIGAGYYFIALQTVAMILSYWR